MKNNFTVKDTPRVSAIAHEADPRTGSVRLNPTKSAWFATHAAVALVGGATTFLPPAVGVGFVTTVVTLGLGHSVGFHRFIVHRSFECPKLLEYALVHLGTLGGTGGPLGIVRMHDTRDRAERHEGCHAFHIDAGPVEALACKLGATPFFKLYNVDRLRTRARNRKAFVEAEAKRKTRAAAETAHLAQHPGKIAGLTMPTGDITPPPLPPA